MMAKNTSVTNVAKRAPFKKKEGATPVDVYVGQRLRQRRTLLGMTQEALAQATGLTFQQIQKYEQGKNRVSASRLHQFCSLLSIPANYFFEGLTMGTTGLAEDQAHFEGVDMTNTRETVELLQIYYSIPDAKVRKNILKLVKQMADNFRQEGA